MHLFLLGELGFWILAGVFLVGTTICIETVSAGFATFLTIVAAALLWQNFDAFTWQQWLMWAAGYLAVGGIWSVVKWFLHVKESVKGLTALSYSDEQRITASRQKARIYMWIVYWPISVVWSVLDDLVIGVVRTIYRSLTGVYDTITANATKGLKK